MSRKVSNNNDDNNLDDSNNNNNNNNNNHTVTTSAFSSFAAHASSSTATTTTTTTRPNGAVAENLDDNRVVGGTTTRQTMMERIHYHVTTAAAAAAAVAAAAAAVSVGSGDNQTNHAAATSTTTCRIITQSRRRRWKVILCFVVLAAISTFQVVQERRVALKLDISSIVPADVAVVASSSSSSSLTAAAAAAAAASFQKDLREMEPTQTAAAAAAAVSSSSKAAATTNSTTSGSWFPSWLSSSSPSSVPVSLVQEARQFIASRRAAYAAQGKLAIWNVRGLGYWSTKHRIILVAQLPSTIQPGRSVIRVDNVYDDHPSIRTDCHLVMIWIRVNGPEIFAGTAQAVQPDDATQESCYWEFTYDLQVPGTYHVDAKVLLWNAQVPTNMTQSIQCPVTKVSTDNDTIVTHARTQLDQVYPNHAGFQGFKLYAAAASCCEVCSRQSECRYWATPPFRMPNPSFITNGCELFFDDTLVDPYVIPNSTRIRDMLLEEAAKAAAAAAAAGPKRSRYQRLLLPQGPAPRSEQRQRRRWRRRLKVESMEHGPPHSYPTAYFAGCGWSFWFTLDYPCLSGDLDDRVYMAQSNFTLEEDKQHFSSGMVSTSSVSAVAPHHQLPLCQLSEMNLKHKGRWVREPFPDNITCPQPIEQDPKFRKASLIKHDGNRPHCWHRDDLTLAKGSCVEMNCRFIPPESLWKSSLHEERTWNGVWRYYGCNLLEFTDLQLQQCINERKISSIAIEGASISENIRQYVDQRSVGLNFFDASLEGARSITVSTLANPHMSWNENEDGWIAKFQGMAPISANNTDYYIVNPFFWSSEREPHVHAGRAENMAFLMQTWLQPKGYKIINALDLTTAFTYDTALQSDGLHITGPPMKMIVTLVFHDLCSGVVEGSIV